MNCQTCRSPLGLHQSLDDLDPAAFDLLLASAAPDTKPLYRPDRLAYPLDRRSRYEDAVASGVSAGVKKAFPANSDGSRKLKPGKLIMAGAGDDPTMSFAILTESELISAKDASKSSVPLANTNAIPPSPSLRQGQPIETATRLFEVLSARSDIDHPICSDCADLLLIRLQQKMKDTTREKEAYIRFLKQTTDSNPTPAQVSQAKSELESIQKAEMKVMTELKALEEERNQVDAEILALDAEAEELDEREAEYWKKKNQVATDLAACLDESDSLRAALEHENSQLEQLRRTNVYNDALHITSDGTFATINGLRLGRLPPKHPVDWSEINAAWGFASLLLATVADKLRFSFQGYRVRPMGSTSRIEKEEQQAVQNSDGPRSGKKMAAQAIKAKFTTLELFSSGDIPIAGTLFLHRRINNAMVAFLECLRQLCEYVQDGAASSAVGSRRPDHGAEIGAVAGMKLPYRVKRDRIGNEEKGYVSIRLDTSSDAEWTDACKYTLTCCKYLLAVMGKVLDSQAP